MTYLSTKLFYCYIRSYIVEKQVKLMLYYLKLSSTLQRLHLVFSMVKLTNPPNNPILERYFSFFPNLVIINREEE